MRTKYLIIVIFLLLSWNCTNPGNQKFSGIQINSAYCEYLVNPLGIDVLHPRLSWKLFSDEKDKSQSAYRVLVASSLDLLDRNKGDLWDTGKKKSDQSIQVAYEGSSLRSRQKCFWKVMVWDEKDAQSRWSDISTWEMALLDNADWRASWIEAPRIYDWTAEIAVIGNYRKTDPKKDFESAPYLRKSFNAGKSIKKARAYISGVGYYEFYINGAKVGDHVLDPTFTNYDKRVHYLSYDVSDLLVKGKNALGILLGDGWYNMHSRAVWGFSQAPWRDRPTCLLQLEIEYEDGTTETVITDGSWKAAPSPIIYNDIREGEKYDARS